METSETYQVPESLLGWINGRLKAAEQPVALNAIQMGDGGACHLTGTVTKFGLSAEMEVRFRVEGREGKLLIHDVDISTSNPIGKTFLPQVRTLMMAKGKEALAPLDIEIVES